MPTAATEPCEELACPHPQQNLLRPHRSPPRNTCNLAAAAHPARPQYSLKFDTVDSVIIIQTYANLVELK
ncbi:UNVERIFIED_CONTAM: hypothetical protein K2H54_044859, partial [Gekko kuhli]